MKRILSGVLMVLLALSARADTATCSLTVTNGGGVYTSDVINVSGWLDKIELITGTTGTPTQSVTIATYSGATALETFATVSALTSTKVVRTRVLPTDNTGTALAYAAASASGGSLSVAGVETNVTAALTNSLVTTQLVVPYAQPWIGGNVKMLVDPAAGSTVGTNTVTATIYYHKAAAFGF